MICRGNNFLWQPYVDIKLIMPHIDQMKVWSILCGYSVKPEQYITNPLRADRNPKCWISKRGTWYRLFDYSDKMFTSMNVIEAIKYQFGIKTVDAINKMIEFNAYGGNNYTKIKYDSYDVKSKFNFKLNYTQRSFLVLDKKYWELRGITKEELEDDGLDAVYNYRCNTRKHPDEFIYVYPRQAYAIKFESGNTKIILPDSKQRFITNCTQEDIGGKFNKKGDQLIVSKSYKDYRQLKNLGYNTCWTMNEGCQPKSLINLATQFKEVVIFYDNDKAGIKAAHKLSEKIPNSRTVFIPEDFGSKDPDDLKVMYWDIEEIINNIINNK